MGIEFWDPILKEFRGVSVTAPLPTALYSGGSAVDLTAASPVVGNVAAGATDSGAPVKAGGINLTTLPTLTDGLRGDLQLGTRGSLHVTLYGPGSTTSPAVTTSFADGASNTVATLAVQARGADWNGTTWDRRAKPNGVSRVVSAAATTNATSAKAAAGNLHNIVGNNASGAIKYLKVYNKATAPTVGTDTPVLTIPLPTGAFSFDFGGLYFATGIAYALTGAAADADTTALTLADILGLSVTYA